MELMSWPAMFMPCAHLPQPVAGGGGGGAVVFPQSDAPVESTEPTAVQSSRAIVIGRQDRGTGRSAARGAAPRT
eukprot:COSAG02_NODE_1139_length_14295_cov_63.689279_3_plen_74_part_00